MSVVDLEKFYGRKEILDLLKKRVLDFKDGYRQNVALLGDRYSGKTVLLQKFLSSWRETDILPLYIELENKDLRYFCLKIVGGLLHRFTVNEKLVQHEDLDVIIQTVSDRLPQSAAFARRVRDLAVSGKELAAYKMAIMFPEVISKETGQMCLVVFDEFHCLADWGGDDIFQELGKVIMTQKSCFYLFASSHMDSAKTILSEKLSLLFGNFETLEIGPFAFHTAQDYIQNYLSGIRIGEFPRDFLIDFTGGHPLYLRLICEELIRLSALLGQQEVFLPLLSRAVENVIFHPWGVLNRHFDLILENVCYGKGNVINARILLVLAKGRQKVKGLAQAVNIKQSALSSRLNRLMEAGLIAKNGKVFYVRERLFRYWLLYVFAQRMIVIDVSPESRRKRFQEEFAHAVEMFRRHRDQAVSSRVIDLLESFEEESLQINGRRYRLPAFARIWPAREHSLPNGRGEFIKAEAPDGEWLVVLKDDSLGEQDIGAIVSEWKKHGKRPQRCIVISRFDLDEAARVRALQERMWIWNEREIKTLLDLYDKSLVFV